MTCVEIVNLKPEYQKMVMKHQKDYNPDFDDILNEKELQIFMTATGVDSPEELLQGYTIEKEQPAKPAQSKNKPEKKRSKQEIENRNGLKLLACMTGGFTIGFIDSLHVGVKVEKFAEKKWGALSSKAEAVVLLSYLGTIALWTAIGLGVFKLIREKYDEGNESFYL